jgi:CRP-like cAMP-binding protein
MVTSLGDPSHSTARASALPSQLMNVTMSPESVVTNELYSMLPPAVCEELQKHEQSMELPQGASLIKHGVSPVGLLILNSGTVQITVPCSRRSISVTTGQKGKVFGMRPAIAGELPDVDVTCLENCNVTMVPRDAFLEVLQANPEIYIAVARVLSGDLQIANRILRGSIRRYSTPRVRPPRTV